MPQLALDQGKTLTVYCCVLTTSRVYAGILQTCRQAYQECLPVLYCSNIFTVLVSQAADLWGISTGRRCEKLIRQVRIEIKIDYEGPTTRFLENVAKARNWVNHRVIGSLREAVVVVYEDEEKADHCDWMPGLRAQVVHALLGLRAPVLTLELEPAVFSRLTMGEQAEDSDRKVFDIKELKELILQWQQARAKQRGKLITIKELQKKDAGSELWPDAA